MCKSRVNCFCQINSKYIYMQLEYTLSFNYNALLITVISSEEIFYLKACWQQNFAEVGTFEMNSFEIYEGPTPMEW